MIAAGAVLLIGGGWVAFRAYQAYTNLDAAAAKVQQLQAQLTGLGTIDEPATRRTVTALQADAAQARSAVDDPLYGVATVVPLIGPNLEAVGRMAATVDSLALAVMPSLVDVATTLQPTQLTPVDGRIPLAPIQQISPDLQSADQEIQQALDSIHGIDRTELAPQIADAVTQLGGRLEQAADVTGPAARIARLAPPMLGADGPRTWLVVFQNPAEPRATGGIFGSFALVRADGGKIDILDRGASSRTLGEFNPPVAELTAKKTLTFSPLMAEFPQDVNLTPNFPRAAQLFSEMYWARTGTAVDGVVAVDPLVLSYVLKGAASLEVDGVALESKSLVETLLSTAYAKFDSRDQSARDDFLAAAGNRIFAATMSGDTDTRSAINGLRQGMRERRVLIFSANSVEEKDLAGTDAYGAFGADPAVPDIGVFLNDATAAKLGYYLQPAVAVTEGECRTDGRRALRVAVTITNDAPSPDSPLPGYVTGDSALGGWHGVLTNVVVAAPSGGGIATVEQDGRPAGFSRGEDQDREIGTVAVQLLPGDSRTIVVTMLGPVGPPATDVEPRVLTTPGVHDWQIKVDPYRACRRSDNS